MRLALTKRTGDAIRMLMYLASLQDGERRTSTQLSVACGVSMGNVPTLVAALSRSDLLDCARGPGGGCRLSRDPSA
ncbi:MAG: Rrf2 family transcriptional regulator, partial [Aquihabitans sp.]